MTEFCSRCGRRVQVWADVYTALWVQVFDDSPPSDCLPCQDYVLCPICRKSFDDFMKKRPNPFR